MTSVDREAGNFLAACPPERSYTFPFPAEDFVMKRTLISTLLAAGILVSPTLVHAADTVKEGGPTDRPGRTIDEEPVKAGGPTDKPGRTADESTVKAGGPTDNPGRSVEEEPFTSQSRTDRPGRSVDDDTVKSGGASERPGREMEADAGQQQ